MSSPYAGDPTAYPITFLIPDDGDPPTAAAINIGLEALGDRTANLDYRLGITRLIASSLSFGPAAARGSAAGRSVYSSRDLLWWSVGGGNDDIRYSTDYGFSWTSASPGASALAAALYDMDVDTNGNLVIVPAASSTFVLSYAATGIAGGGSWGKTSVFGSAPTRPCVVFDPVHSLWCVIGYDTAQRVYTSPDRSTWTARTSLLAGTQRPVMAVNKVSGRIVAMNTSGGTTVKVQTSDDGGVSWTLRADISPSIGGLSSNTFPMALAYSEAEGAWLMCVRQSGSIFEVWRSVDDGTTWALRATINTQGPVFGSLLAVGSAWIAFSNTANGLIYSLDSGLTWRATGWRPSTTVDAVWLAQFRGAVLLTTTINGTTGLAYPSAAKTDLFGTVIA
jgi:hypothetical protein